VNVPARFLASILFLFAAGSFTASAQQGAPNVGFVRLVNVAAAGEGNLMVSIDGNSYWREGIELGQRSGGIGLKAGKKEFVLTKTGCKGAKRTIEIVPGETQTLVFYSLPVRDEAENIVAWELKVARLRQHTPDQGLHLTVISFCEEQELPVEIFETASQVSKKVLVPKMRTTRVELDGALVSAEIRHKEEVVTTVLAERRGNYIVMLYTDGEGARKGISFYDPKFVLAN
jgi:hypothetical protein